MRVFKALFLRPDLIGKLFFHILPDFGGSFAPRIKVSENAEKITNPGLKQVYRVYDENGKSVADLIACADEFSALPQNRGDRIFIQAV